MKKKLISFLMMIAMIAGLFAVNVSASDVTSYNDVDRSCWYYSAVKYVTEHGIMKGTSDKSFSPLNDLTKQMFAEVLYNIENETGSNSYSSKVSALSWAINSAIIAGDGSVNIDTSVSVTREELATMLFKYAAYKGYIDGTVSYTADLSKYADSGAVSEWAENQIMWAVSAGMLAGSDGYLKPKVIISRAETAIVIARFMDTYVYPGTVTWYDVKAVNHRGYSTVAPENTLSAYRLSKQMGFEYVETDVTLTKDRVPVILHDATINRTARNADGTEIADSLNISDLTLAEVRQYDFGIWKNQQYAGEKIPTFEEFISLCSELGLKPYIELKSNGGFVKDDINYLLTIIDKYNMRDNITWTSFSADLLKQIIELDPNGRIGYTTSKVNEKVIDTALSFENGKNSVFVDAGTYNDEAVELCKNAGLDLEAWTIDDENVIKSLSPYISGVTSNCLNAQNILNSK